MASYTRQSTFSDGDLITAALFNDEYNQLVAAFDNATGHRHDGTVGEGPVISVLGDAGLATPLNKILIDTTNDHIEFWIDVSGTSTQQLYIADGAIVPVTDNDIDLGTNSLQFKDLYINGTANIDNLAADSVDINGGNIDGTVIGATTAAAGTFTTIDASSNVVISGNLTVSGTTTSVNSNEVNIGDNIIVLNSDETGTPSQNAGIEIERGTSTNVSLLWNESNDYWTFGSDDLNFPDSSKAKFGTGNDLEIYHDGSNSYVADRGTGNLRLEGTNIALNNQTSSKTYLLATDGGSVQLRHNDATKFETTSTGIDVTGTVTSDGVVSDGNVVIDGLLQFEDSGGSNRTVIEYDSNDDVLIKTGTSSGSRSIRFQTEASEVMRIDANARVGIGTASPNYLLDLESTGSTLLRLNSTSGESVLQISVPDTTSFADINFGDSGSTTSGQIRYRHNGDSMAFSTGGTERARIDSNGNLLIGTTAADIVGSSTATGINLNPNSASSFNRSGGAPLFVNRIGSDGTLLQFRKSGVTVGEIGTNSGYVRIGTGDTHLLYHSGIDTIIPYSGSANRDNAISLGYSGARFKDLHLSGTANFGSLSDGTTTITGFVDEDNMSSNSATLLPTQQSVKAYVDSQISSAGGNGISFEDNEKAQFGDGNDLQIYHDGSHSYIADVGTGDLIIQAGNDLILNDPNSVEYLRGNQGAGVEINHNGSTKLLTTSTGIDVTGTVTSDGLTVDGVGSLDNNGLNLELSSSNTGIIYDAQNGYHTFKRNGTNALQINGGTGDVYFYDDTGTTQGLFWDASAESLGLGTSSPTAKLEISTTDGVESLRINSSDIQVTDGELIGEILFTSNDATLNADRKVLAGIKTFAAENFAGANANEASLQFFTANSNDLRNSAAPSPRMTINEDGLVGIGTDSPNNKLTVSGASDGINIVGTNSFVRWNSGNMMIRDEGSYAMGFHTYDGSTGQVERMRITSAGEVLVGKTDTTFSNAGIEARANGNFRAIRDGANVADFNRLTSDGNIVAFYKDGTAKAVIGSVYTGLGTGSPATPLHVYHATINEVARFESGDADARITIRDNTSDANIVNNAGALTINADANNAVASSYMRFNVDGSERARIDSSGHLLVGKTGASSGTQGQELRSNGYTVFTRSGGNPLELNRLTSNGTILNFSKDTSVVGKIGTDAGTIYISGGTGSTGLYFGSTNIYPMDAEVVVDNAVDIGHGSYKFRNLYLSNSAYVKNIGGTTDTDTYINFGDAANVMKFFTGGSERARIDSNGRLGIGTTAPTEKLHVEGNIELINNGYIGSLDGSYWQRIRFEDDTPSSTNAFNFETRNGSGSFINHMTITNNGDIGIGTSSPAKQLHVYQPSGQTGIVLSRTNNIAGVNLQFSVDSSKTRLLSYGDALSFWTAATGSGTNASEKARIDSSGNLLVGKTAADISTDGIELGTRVESTADGTYPLRLNRRSSDGEIINFRKNNGTVGRISTTSTGIALGTPLGSGSGIHLVSNAILPSTSTGGTADNLHDLGSTSSRFKDLRLGGKAYVAAMNVDAAADDGIKISSTSPYLFFNDTDTANGYDGSISQSGTTTNIGGASTAQTLVFRNKASFAESARIDSSGNILVGKTSTSYANEGIALRADNNGVMSTVTDNYSFVANRLNSDGNLILFAKDTATVGRISTTGGDILIGTGDCGIRFSDGGDQIRVCTDTGTNRDGAIDLGYSDSRFKDLHLSGTGYFGTSVGIGTTSPDAPLTVHNSSDPEIRFGYSSTQDHRINWDSSKVFIDADPDNANGSSAIGFRVDGSEKARIDSSGNLLVGKTSTSVATVGAKIAPTGEITATVSGDKTLTLNRTTSDGDIVQFRRDNTAVGSIGVGSTNVALRIGVDEASAINNSFISFRTDGSEKAQINAAGNFYVGTTTGQTTNSDITTRAAISGDVYLNGVRFNTNTSEAAQSVSSSKLWNDGGDLMIGSVVIETGATSDRRLKENIENIPNAIEKVKLLNGVTYNYKKKPDVKEAGFIAQDVEKALPEAVYTAYEDGEEVLALKYNRITSVLVEAMKEQQEQIESLKSEIANLKGEKNGN